MDANSDAGSDDEVNPGPVTIEAPKDEENNEENNNDDDFYSKPQGLNESAKGTVQVGHNPGGN